ncbi:MAG: Gfo/Idh/MocA family oxidoreductase, partial [Gemmatimonadota bacterium]|nr:Gfo/Idh/MocA family oxidoreductase [Gemmatimonadota bacterium]
MSSKIGVGFVGAGFIANFHIRSWQGVREADIVGIADLTESRAIEAAENCRKYRVGDPKVYRSVTELIEDPRVDVLWICVPNYVRIPLMEEIAGCVKSGHGKLVGIACEKPLGRNVAEASRMLELAKEADLLHGYLENQVFSPAVNRGRDIIWKRG